MRMRTFDEADVAGKRVLVRVDFNVPLDDEGQVADDTRVRAALPTVRALTDDGAKVVLMSHLGRPKGDGPEPGLSLRPVANVLAGLLGRPVAFASDTVGPDARAKAAALGAGDVLLLENLRFDAREKQNDPAFARELAALADLYVDDAFGTAHRAHASTVGVAQCLPAFAGLLMQKEVGTLTRMLDEPKRPFLAVLGGSKASDKIAAVDALLDKADAVLVGGGMCFTFLASEGLFTGKSLMEPDLVDECGRMVDKARRLGKRLLLPSDVVAADRFAADAATKTVPVDKIPDDGMGLDIGPETAKAWAHEIAGAKTVFWNGPMGVFEMPAFAKGTEAIARAMAESPAETVIGGGDSVAAIDKLGLAGRMSFVSTGGGASMRLVEGKDLPGVDVLSH